jgi:acetyltransferase-like isoleucine patch superfamily enzyme
MMKLHPDAAARAAAFDRITPAMGVLLFLYRLRAVRPAVIWLARRLRPIPRQWALMRGILARHHDVDIGRYSYGSILTPGVLPRGTRVGRWCSVGSDLIVRRRNHPLDAFSQHPFFYNAALGLVMRDAIPADTDNPLLIGDDVWIGDRVIILPGCRRVGDRAVIAAGAVVTRDVGEGMVVGGVPARVIGRRGLGDPPLTEWIELTVTEVVTRLRSSFAEPS